MFNRVVVTTAALICLGRCELPSWGAAAFSSIAAPNHRQRWNIYESGLYLLDFSELMYGCVDFRKAADLEPSNVQGSEDILNKMPISVIEIKHNLTAKDSDWVLSVFDEEDRLDGLVYGTAVNHRMKRVDVGFRGTVNVDNWLTDAEAWMSKVEKPFFGEKSAQQPEHFYVHHGFDDYMNQIVGSGTKYQEIVDRLLPVLRENPDYKLYVTGHSLGAALASLFAFLVSSQPDNIIPTPVTCISCVSPYVGDINFQKAFKFAESTGMLRYLCITGHKDIVPTIPFVSLGRLKPFAHVGINLMLFDGGQYKLSYPKKERLSLGGIIQSLENAWITSFLANWNFNFDEYHHLKTYNARFQSAKHQTDETSLDALYENQTLVGNLIVAGKPLSGLYGEL